MDAPNNAPAGATADEFWNFNPQQPPPLAGGAGQEDTSLDELLALYQTANDAPGAAPFAQIGEPDSYPSFGGDAGFGFGDPATDQPFPTFDAPAAADSFGGAFDFAGGSDPFGFDTGSSGFDSSVPGFDASVPNFDGGADPFGGLPSPHPEAELSFGGADPFGNEVPPFADLAPPPMEAGSFGHAEPETHFGFDVPAGLEIAGGAALGHAQAPPQAAPQAAPVAHPSPAASDDLFGAASGGGDLFGTPDAFGAGADPFGHTAGADAFGAAGADPFGAAGADPFGTVGAGDAFGAASADAFGAAGADPFGAAPAADAFGSAADPFGAGATPDAFGADPFGAGAAPDAFGADPFGAGADPFGHTVAGGAYGASAGDAFGGVAESDPFGSAGGDLFGAGGLDFGAPETNGSAGGLDFGAPETEAFGGVDPFGGADPFAAPAQGDASSTGLEDLFGADPGFPPLEAAAVQGLQEVSVAVPHAAPVEELSFVEELEEFVPDDDAPLFPAIDETSLFAAFDTPAAHAGPPVTEHQAPVEELDLFGDMSGPAFEALEDAGAQALPAEELDLFGDMSGPVFPALEIEPPQSYDTSPDLFGAAAGPVFPALEEQATHALAAEEAVEELTEFVDEPDLFGDMSGPVFPAFSEPEAAAPAAVEQAAVEAIDFAQAFPVEVAAPPVPVVLAKPALPPVAPTPQPLVAHVAPEPVQRAAEAAVSQVFEPGALAEATGREVAVRTSDDRKMANQGLFQAVEHMTTHLDDVQGRLAALYGELQRAAVRRASVSEINDITQQLGAARAALSAGSEMHKQALYMRQVADAYLELIEGL